MEVSPPNKRQKMPSPSPGGKGKAKMESGLEGGGAGEDLAADADGRTCGICFTEEGWSIRGAIDGCDHYFCFVCIMEWAKIESRCPLCKQRFGSIRRPPVRGVFFCERVVRVPVRDQVDQLFGSATGGGDPYEDTTCSACHSSTDEDLLLLCDLCDSAAHTYCVGLGGTVPEGDWYCHDCTILRDEHTKMQDADCGSSEHLDSISRTMTEEVHPVSIFDIIRDEPSFNSFCGSRAKVIGRGTNDERTIQGRGIAERESQDRTSVEGSSQGNVLHSYEGPSPLAHVRESASSFPATEFGARTLNQCRNLHLRIRILRENWRALQSGSLDFKSRLVSSCGTSKSRKNNNKGVISVKSGQQDYQSSADNEEATAGSRVSCEMNSCINSGDVDKAWKMLEIVKSMQRAPTGARSSHQSPKLYGKKIIYENKVLEHRAIECISDPKFQSCPVSRVLHEDKTRGNGLFGGIEREKHLSHSSFEIVQDKCKQQRPVKLAKGEIGHYDIGTSLSSVGENSKSNQEQCHGEEGQGSLHVMYHASRLVRLKDVPACSGPSSCTQVGTFGPSAGKKEAVDYVGCKILPSYVDSVLKKNADESSTRICDSAKSEIQSLVKLNLKLQCRGHHLATEKFKEVARVATHTILAACGLDHSKTKSRPSTSSICRHSDEAKLHRRSNLMPDSCRECFYSFVKDVVDSVVSEKTSVSDSN